MLPAAAQSDRARRAVCTRLCTSSLTLFRSAPSQLQTAETTETTETTNTAGCVREVVGCQHAGLDCALWDATTRLGCHTTSLASGVYPVLCLCLCAKGLCALRLCA